MLAPQMSLQHPVAIFLLRSSVKVSTAAVYYPQIGKPSGVGEAGNFQNDTDFLLLILKFVHITFTYPGLTAAACKSMFMRS